MSLPQATAIREHRRQGESRIICDRPLPIVPLGRDPEQPITAQLTDCSLQGLGLMTSDPLEPGGQFTVQLDLGHPTRLLYTVRYCIPMATNQFRVGATFTGYAAATFQGQLADVLDALTAR